MTGLALALIAAVLAFLVLKFDIFPEFIQGRLAAVLAMAGVGAIVLGTRVGDWVRQGVDYVVEWTARLVGTADAALGAAVGQVAIIITALIVGLLWLAALLPSLSARFVGGVANRNFSLGLIWGGAVFLPLFAATVPGILGDLVEIAPTIGREIGGAIASGVAS